MRRLRVLVGLSAIALAACGPVPDLLIGVRSLVLPIVLSGSRPATSHPTPGPAATLAPLAGLPAPLPAAAGTTVQLPPPSPACPDAGPLTFPAVAATDFVASAAPDGSYPYRATVQRNGGSSTVYETRAVHDAQGSNGAFSFAETISGGPQDNMTYTYQADASQVALTRIQFPDGVVFRPLTPIKLLQTPADPTAGGWTSVGADPTSGISMTYQAQGVTGRRRVNACGQLVDSWEVKATATLVEPPEGEKVDETLTYDFATQYGGLIVQEIGEYAYSGIKNQTAAEAAAIDVVP